MNFLYYFRRNDCGSCSLGVDREIIFIFLFYLLY